MPGLHFWTLESVHSSVGGRSAAVTCFSGQEGRSCTAPPRVDRPTSRRQSSETCSSCYVHPILGQTRGAPTRPGNGKPRGIQRDQQQNQSRSEMWGGRESPSNLWILSFAATLFFLPAPSPFYRSLIAGFRHARVILSDAPLTLTTGFKGGGGKETLKSKTLACQIVHHFFLSHLTAALLRFLPPRAVCCVSDRTSPPSKGIMAVSSVVIIARGRE